MRRPIADFGLRIVLNTNFESLNGSCLRFFIPHSAIKKKLRDESIDSSRNHRGSSCELLKQKEATEKVFFKLSEAGEEAFFSVNLVGVDV
ncbi:MAG: hypothetical protein ABFD69_13810 [Candidatus Sumerlaeia bacterium]